MNHPRGAGSLVLPALVLTLLGCTPTTQPDPPAQPFVFRELNLRRQDEQGRPLWELSSPETRYDLSRKLAQSRDLTGVLYEQGQPRYRFSAANGVVLNDGELVQLEGPIRLERLDPERPLLLTGQRLRWYPDEERMEIDRAPRATSADLQLSAGLARFLIAEDRLELRQGPLLLQAGVEPLQLALGEVDWTLSTALLQARGPIRGQRRLSGGGLQRLTAPALSGDTRAQTIDLQPPVRLEDPQRQAVINARATRLDLPSRQAISREPFQGRYGSTSFQGGGFRLDALNEILVVENGCRLEQPGDQLQAGRCRWDWGSGEVEASGAVRLQRQDDGLATTAERLVGRIGTDGFAEFSSPGGQVRSELRLPTDAGGSGAVPFSGDRDPARRGGRTRAPAFQL
ncbi:MAG: LPS export ABC transporter periplasmic protein LptC [Cyanobacteria bacterium J06638_7]